jgi:putative transposase
LVFSRFNPKAPCEMSAPKFRSKRVAWRDLPHLTPNDAPYFITFCLSGCYERELDSTKTGAMKFGDFDKLLDRTPAGPHHLKDVRCAKIVYDKLMWLAAEVLEMHTFTIMSNHVHLMVSLHKEQDMSELLRLVKGSTARDCNKVLGLTGQKFWQSERYDRVLRWNEHRVTFNYIVNNPVKAGLVSHWREHPWTYVNEKLHFVDE